MYLFIFAIMRVFRRQTGALSTADLLVIVLVADAAQNGMASDYHSLTEGAVVVCTIFGWNFLLDWLSFRSPRLRRLINASPLLLIENGRVVHTHLRAQLLTPDDLLQHLREQGVGRVEDVRRCLLESDGHISVMRWNEGIDPPEIRAAN
mgnify:CR=1 FL=1